MQLHVDFSDAVYFAAATCAALATMHSKLRLPGQLRAPAFKPH